MCISLMWCIHLFSFVSPISLSLDIFSSFECLKYTPFCFLLAYYYLNFLIFTILIC